MTIKDLWHEIPVPSEGYEDTRIKVNYARIETYAFFEPIPSGEVEISLVYDRDKASTVGLLDMVCGHSMQMTKRVRMQGGPEVRVIQTSYTKDTLTLYLKEE